MPKFVIERDIPGAGAMSREELHAASTLSCAVLDQLGPDIQWVHSYVTQDKLYCVYIAPSEQMIREFLRTMKSETLTLQQYAQCRQEIIISERAKTDFGQKFRPL